MTIQATAHTNDTDIQPGDIIKVLEISTEFISHFPKDHHDFIRSMVGNFFQVIELDEDKNPCILREWQDEEGNMQAHIIALDSHEYVKA